ncbi:MAG: gliding motility-associated C-terminal domain-containing protein [Bacteroidetes bacterium]|nr:gliding motility-associated C-terminal domain-containing protein [Bacteroidota bacterium]
MSIQRYTVILLIIITTMQSGYAQGIPSQGLVGCYPFDGNANDYSGNNNHGTPMGATLTTNRFNQPNRAYDFNGIDNYILVNTSNTLDSIELLNSVSIAGWIYIRNWYQGWNIFNMMNRYRVIDDDGWSFEVADKWSHMLVFAPTFSSFSGAPWSPSFNTWYHVAITNNKAGDDSIRFYVNGLKIYTEKAPQPIPNTNHGPLYFGWSRFSVDEFSDGKLDNFYIYNRALSDAEIQILYHDTSGCSIAPSPTVTPPPASDTTKTCGVLVDSIPNVFTPNDDHVNDRFYIPLTSSKCPEKGIFTIYDRWGLVIFKSEVSGQTFWDGRTTSGEKAVDGAYFYIIRFDEKTYRGVVQLFR